MYGIVKSLANGIGRLAACFLPFGLVPLCRSFLAYLYTGFVRRNFASWGEGSVMVYKPVYLLGMKYVHVGRGTVIEKEACITAYDSYDSHDGRQTFNPCIRIGNDCHIGVNVHITAIDCIEIGDNLLTGSNVLITDNAHGLFDNVDNLKISLDKDMEYMFYATMIVDGKNKIGKNYDGIYGKPFMSSLTNKFVKEQTFDTYYIWNGGTDMADGSYYTRPATDRYFGLTDAYDPDSKTPSPVVINTVRSVFGVNVKVKNLSEGEVSVALLESPPFIITASRPEASGLFTLSDLKEAFFTDAFGKTDITNEYCEDINVVVMQEVDGKDTPVVYEEMSFRRNMMNNIEITIPEISEGKIQVSVEETEMEDDPQEEINFAGGGSVIKK